MINNIPENSKLKNEKLRKIGEKFVHLATLFVYLRGSQLRELTTTVSLL